MKDGTITGSSRTTGEDDVDRASAAGAVAGGTDIYRFTGTLQGVDVDGPVDVVLNGQPLGPASVRDTLFHSTLRFVGRGRRASYEFGVSGEIKHSRRLTGEDEAGETGASGAVAGGSAAYVYSGTLESLRTDGDVSVLRDGREITEDDI